MPDRLALSLFVLRLTVFIVMAMWSLDKLLNPGHATAVFESFYYLEGIATPLLYAVGITQLLIEIAFLLGVARFWTYGFVLLAHTASTLAAWQQYLDPFNNMLFLTAFPMLGACLALFLLRDRERFLVLGGR